MQFNYQIMPKTLAANLEIQWAIAQQQGITCYCDLELGYTVIKHNSIAITASDWGNQSDDAELVRLLSDAIKYVRGSK